MKNTEGLQMNFPFLPLDNLQKELLFAIFILFVGCISGIYLIEILTRWKKQNFQGLKQAIKYTIKNL
jgi:hypothetical protein